MSNLKRGNEELDSSERPTKRSKEHNSPTSTPRQGILIDLEDTDLVHEDDDDIPYTHARSRSTTPVFLSSELDSLLQEVVRDTDTHNGNNDNEQVIVLDDEDDAVREYYVLSDDEDEDINTEKEAKTDASESKQKSTVQQLEETKTCTSNLSGSHCAVCFDSPESTFILRCGHIYCGDCVFKALSSTKKSTHASGPCSLCRAMTPYKSITLGIFKKKKKVLGT